MLLFLQADTFADFEVMTDKLVGEINYHIEMYGFTPSRLRSGLSSAPAYILVIDLQLIT